MEFGPLQSLELWENLANFAMESFIVALSFFRFDGESTLSFQAANPSR